MRWLRQVDASLWSNDLSEYLFYIYYIVLPNKHQCLSSFEWSILCWLLYYYFYLYIYITWFGMNQWLFLCVLRNHLFVFQYFYVNFIWLNYWYYYDYYYYYEHSMEKSESNSVWDRMYIYNIYVHVFGVIFRITRKYLRKYNNSQLNIQIHHHHHHLRHVRWQSIIYEIYIICMIYVYVYINI